MSLVNNQQLQTSLGLTKNNTTNNTNTNDKFLAGATNVFYGGVITTWELRCYEFEKKFYIRQENHGKQIDISCHTKLLLSILFNKKLCNSI